MNAATNGWDALIALIRNAKALAGLMALVASIFGFGWYDAHGFSTGLVEQIQGLSTYYQSKEYEEGMCIPLEGK